MASLGIYYIDGSTLANATAVFQDAALTIAAPDGFYSQNTTVRKQVGGTLLTIQTCSSCLVPCDSNIALVGGSETIYSVSFDIGSLTGCVIVYFTVSNIPEGIRLSWGGNIYNEITSPTFGYLGGATPGNYNYIGNTANDCGIAATLAGGGYSNFDEKIWDGSAFVTVGNSGSATGVGADVNLTAGNPSTCTLFIPKPSPVPSTLSQLEVQVISPCPIASGWDVTVQCTNALTAVATTNAGGSCGDAKPNSFYNVPNSGGTAGDPAINEFFVSDFNGSSKVPAGDYVILVGATEKEITVDANGVITSLSACPP